MSSERTSETPQQQSPNDVMSDPVVVSHAETLRNARQMKGMNKQTPWKAKELCNMQTMRDLIIFKARENYPAFILDDDAPREGDIGIAAIPEQQDAPAVPAEPAVDVADAGVGNANPAPIANTFEMVFASIDGSPGISFQESGMLLQDTTMHAQQRWTTLRFLPDVSRRWQEQREKVRQAEFMLHEVLIPDLAAICAVYAQPWGARLGMWHWLDSLVSEYCMETSFSFHNNHPLSQEWLQGDGYMPLCRFDEEKLQCAVELKLQCDNDGNPFCEIRDESNNIIYRHTNYQKQLQAWNVEDTAYARLRGHPRTPYITSEAAFALLKASQQVRLLFHYRGFGYILNKVVNFGYVTVIQLLPHSASSSL